MSCPIIQQGDSYLFGNTIRFKQVVITSEMVREVRMGLGPFVEQWPDGKLTYSDGRWWFDLSRQQSEKLIGDVEIQAQFILNNGEKHGTGVKTVDVRKSILKGAWD